MNQYMADARSMTTEEEEEKKRTSNKFAHDLIQKHVQSMIMISRSSFSSNKSRKLKKDLLAFYRI